MYHVSISRVVSGIPTTVTLPVSGCDAAYAAFRMACELTELTGGTVVLYDWTTGEALADNIDEGEADF